MSKHKHIVTPLGSQVTMCFIHISHLRFYSIGLGLLAQDESYSLERIQACQPRSLVTSQKTMAMSPLFWKAWRGTYAGLLQFLLPEKFSIENRGEAKRTRGMCLPASGTGSLTR